MKNEILKVTLNSIQSQIHSQFQTETHILVQSKIQFKIKF